jgi:hypothetical protein
VLEVANYNLVVEGAFSLDLLDLSAVDLKVSQVDPPLLGKFADFLLAEAVVSEFLARNDAGDEFVELERHAIDGLFEMLLPEVALLLGDDLHDALPVFVDGDHQNRRDGLGVLSQMLVDAILQHEEPD